MERTFVMVKPKGVARGLVGEVVARFERRGFTLRGMKALRIGEGKPQKITFAPIADVKAGTPAVTLVATSDAGLPVQFFVQAGPAIIRDGQVVLTPIPPRSRYPVEVTVVAWQWGRASEPKVKTAALVPQTFRILAP